MTIQREPDELWSSYLMRRLEAEGFRFKDGDLKITQFRDEATKFILNENVIGFELLPPPYANIAISQYLVNDEMLGSLVQEHRLELRQRDYTDFRCSLLKAEDVSLGTLARPDALYRAFLFSAEGTVSLQEYDKTSGPLPDYLMKYALDQTYPAAEVIEDIVRYCCENKSEVLPEEAAFGLVREEADAAEIAAHNFRAELGVPKPIEEAQEAPLGTRPKKEISPLERRIEELHRDVRTLLRIAGNHPVVMKEEGTYLSELYVRTINEDVNNLQVFEYRGKRIPYVLVPSADLEGQIGRPFHNLYFVARDLAPEEWQQQIVAFHESECLHFGHDRAKRKEPRLARFLGKEQEYLRWRRMIDLELKCKEK